MSRAERGEPSENWQIDEKEKRSETLIEQILRKLIYEIENSYSSNTGKKSCLTDAKLWVIATVGRLCLSTHFVYELFDKFLR